MKVNECFYSIQGEGPTIGEPAVFLRTQLCNLRCCFCDTKYTWSNKKGKEISIEELVEKIERGWQCKNPIKQKRLVITGGEPLLQKNEIDKLLDFLFTWKIEIETNGTIMPTMMQLQCCQINCSPKLKNSGNYKEIRINKDVLKILANPMINSFFKFVVATPEDLDEIERDFIVPIGIPLDKVILMPLGTSPKELRKNALRIVESVKEKGYRMIGRFQVDLWGMKKGV